MNCYPPPPAVRLFRRETRVVVPSLIEEFDGTNCRLHHSQRRDGFDHPLEGIGRFPHFVERQRPRYRPKSASVLHQATGMAALCGYKTLLP